MMGNKAFTLIELLVVVLIIGILSAIALPQYQKAVERTRVSEVLITLKSIQQNYVIKSLEDPSFYQDTYDPKDFVELSGGIWGMDGETRIYCRKHFVYYFEGVDISAFRSNDISAGNCSGYSNGLYQIGVEVPPESTENKWCSVYTDQGYQICKWLEGQGFAFQDLR